MKKVKIYRATCSNSSLVWYVNFFVNILKKKYEVVIDDQDPDIVFISNLFTDNTKIDEWSKLPAKITSDYPNSIKIFISGEHVLDYSSYLYGPDWYTIGTPHSQTNIKSLDCPSYVMASIHQLHHDCGFFNDEFSWLTEQKNINLIMNQKKHFCGIVQKATNNYRKEIYNKLEKKYYIKACGSFSTTVSREEEVFSTYNETLDIRNKVNFFKDCFFTLNIQYEDVPGFTPDKIIQAYAANTIPIFYGNSLINNDGFNPDSFVNCHEFGSIDEVVEEIVKIYGDKTILKNKLSQPIFVDNKIPDKFNNENILNFFEMILEPNTR